MLKRKIEPRGDEIEIFVPEDQKERDLLAGIVNHHIPERYNVLASECDGTDWVWPEYIAFGMILTRARMVGRYEGDPIDSTRSLMGVYFRAYLTTDPEQRILINLVIEDNKQKHLAAICELVSKHGPGRAHAWTAEEALQMPCPFMHYVNEALDSDPTQRMEWIQI